MALKAVIFDLDGTLLDRERSLDVFVRAQYDKWCGRLAPASREAYAKRFIELDDHGMVWKDEVYQKLLQEFSIRGIGWEELLRDYEENFCRFGTGFPGMVDALAVLRRRGLKLAIISNGRYPFQLRNAEALGVVPMLEFVMVSEQEGVRKPDAEIFRRALARLDVEEVDAVYVGDHPDTDIRGAKRAGLRTVWRPSKQFAACAEADAICANLSELPEVISRLG